MQNPKQIFASTLKYLRYKHHFSQEKLVIQMQIRGSTITREVYKFIESGFGNIKVFDLVILKISIVFLTLISLSVFLLPHFHELR